MCRLNRTRSPHKQDNLSAGPPLSKDLRLADLRERHPLRDGNDEATFRDGLCESSQSVVIGVDTMQANFQT